MRTVNDQTKKKFIEAAILEMRDHGIADFSLRRVSQRCGTTSGAPYRHFKDRNALILEVLKHINSKWHEAQREILGNLSGTYRDEIVEISMRYVMFLYENREFQTILMMNDSSMTEEQKVEKAKISEITTGIIDKYCESVNMSYEARTRKTYSVRSFIYGAALMFNSGYMPYNKENLDMVRACIEREFDLS